MERRAAFSVANGTAGQLTWEEWQRGGVPGERRKHARKHDGPGAHLQADFILRV